MQGVQVGGRGAKQAAHAGSSKHWWGGIWKDETTRQHCGSDRRVTFHAIEAASITNRECFKKCNLHPFGVVTWHGMLAWGLRAMHSAHWPPWARRGRPDGCPIGPRQFPSATIWASTNAHTTTQIKEMTAQRLMNLLGQGNSSNVPAGSGLPRTRPDLANRRPPCRWRQCLAGLMDLHQGIPEGGPALLPAGPRGHDDGAATPRHRRLRHLQEATPGVLPNVEVEDLQQGNTGFALWISTINATLHRQCQNWSRLATYPDLCIIEQFWKPGLTV
jgi:hypothetical protein